MNIQLALIGNLTKKFWRPIEQILSIPRYTCYTLIFDNKNHTMTEWQCAFLYVKLTAFKMYGKYLLLDNKVFMSVWMYFIKSLFATTLITLYVTIFKIWRNIKFISRLFFAVTHSVWFTKYFIYRIQEPSICSYTFVENEFLSFISFTDARREFKNWGLLSPLYDRRPVALFKTSICKDIRNNLSTNKMIR